MKLNKIIAFNKVIADLKLTSLSGKDKYTLFKIFRQFKVVENEFNQFKADVINKYTQTDEFKEKLEAYNNEDEEAKKWINNLNNEVTNILAMELNTDKEVILNPVSEDLFVALIDGNDLSLSETSLLEEVLIQNV